MYNRKFLVSCMTADCKYIYIFQSCNQLSYNWPETFRCTLSLHHPINFTIHNLASWYRYYISPYNSFIILIISTFTWNCSNILILNLSISLSLSLYIYYYHSFLYSASWVLYHIRYAYLLQCFTKLLYKFWLLVLVYVNLKEMLV